jgi:hypothetical protein
LEEKESLRDAISQVNIEDGNRVINFDDRQRILGDMTIPQWKHILEIIKIFSSIGVILYLLIKNVN